MVFWSRLGRVQTYHWDFQNYLISSGIFIEPTLREEFREMSNMNYDAIEERKIDKELGGVPGPDRFPKGDLMQREGGARMNAMLAKVQSRLWDAEKLEPTLDSAPTAAPAAVS